MLEAGREFAYPILMKNCAAWVVDPTEGFRIIKSLEKSCANPDTLARIEDVGQTLGQDRAGRSRFCSAAQAAGLRVCMAVAGVVGRRRMMSVR